MEPRPGRLTFGCALDFRDRPRFPPVQYPIDTAVLPFERALQVPAFASAEGVRILESANRGRRWAASLGDVLQLEAEFIQAPLYLI